MIYFKKIYAVVLLVFSIGLSQAQWLPDLCVDEIKVNPFFPCPEIFSPVCACNGETYWSPCAAENHGGVVQGRYISGVCGEFDCFISPNPTSQFLRLKIQFAPGGGSATAFIIDLMGVVQLQRIYNAANDLPLIDDLPVGNLRTGMYILLVQGRNMQRVKRFGKN